MHLFTSVIAFALAITVVAASNAHIFPNRPPRALKAHTQCCAVTGLGANQQMSSQIVPAFQRGKKAYFKGKNLRKRFGKCPKASREVLNSSDDATFEIDSGDGLCGAYDSDTTLGACLFSGTDQTGADPTLGGWISWSQHANCGRKLVAWMDGQAPVEMPVVEGCTFFTPDDAEASCPDIAFTVASFLAVAGTNQVTAVEDGHLSNVHWKWVDQPL